MKGCDIEWHDLRNLLHPFDNYQGHNEYLNQRIQLGAILRYELGKKYFNKYENKGPFISSITQTEGPFRYYNLQDSNMVKEYYQMWEDAMKICYDDIFLKRTICGSTYMLIDNIPFSITNQLLNITTLNFDKFWHTVNIYYQDRHFFPRGTTGGDGKSLYPSDTVEDFLELNKDHIKWLKDNKSWID